jgi:FlaA1/EpsC-like NDP-sugar epimerase
MGIGEAGPGRLGAYRLAQMAAGVRADVAFALLDACLVAGSYLLVGALIRDETWGRRPGVVAAWFLVAVVANLSANVCFGLYGRMWRHASVDEARRVIGAAAAAGGLLGLASVAFFAHPPVRLISAATALTVLAVGGVRFRARLFAFQREPRGGGGLQVAVIGSRDMAAAIIRDMRRYPDAGFQPAVALDDDASVRGRTVAGVPVVGGIGDLPQVARRHQLHQALLAMSSAPPELVRRAAEAAEAAGIPIKILPSMRELVDGKPSLGDARDLRIEDLVGRSAVHTDLQAVGSLLCGRRVLVTGGGGSIGSEIARQVATFGPEQVLLLDHDETHLHDTCAGLGAEARMVLADIRERNGLFRIFSRLQPEVVFHAAAHKHVPMLEAFPLEAARTNVLGTLNVVDASVAAGVSRLVFISTDKAVRPTSVLGASKWLGEQLVLASCPAGAAFCAVRFGNVLGSRGSVVPTFARQIAAGGPVTVTDPAMTRYFMTISEAVQLVLQASVLARGGDLLVLDMGEPVNILELAHRMICLSGRRPGLDVEVKVVGPRPGEKTSEELRLPAERALDSPHPSILRLEPVQLAPAQLAGLLDELAYASSLESDERARRAFARLVEGPAGDLDASWPAPPANQLEMVAAAGPGGSSRA